MCRTTTTLLAAGLLLLSSCSRYYYMPNMHNVPLLRAKGEGRLAIAESSDAAIYAEVSGVELQASAAVTDRLGVMLNAAWFTSMYSNSTGRIVEAGLGRYHTIGRHGVLECYGGLGRGEVVNEGDRTPLWRTFAQPSIGYASRHFDVALTTRFCMLWHDRTQVDGALPPEMMEVLDVSGKPRMLIEPGLVLRAGFRSVKLQIQYVNSSNQGRPMPMLHENISVGLQFNINNSLRRRKPVEKLRT